MEKERQKGGKREKYEAKKNRKGKMESRGGENVKYR
jgi:hypothetical protein